MMYHISVDSQPMLWFGDFDIVLSEYTTNRRDFILLCPARKPTQGLAVVTSVVELHELGFEYDKTASDKTPMCETPAWTPEVTQNVTYWELYHALYQTPTVLVLGLDWNDELFKVRPYIEFLRLASRRLGPHIKETLPDRYEDWRAAHRSVFQEMHDEQE